MSETRNIAIIAHVDHGKTTLVDALLKQSKTKLKKGMAGTERIMDSNEIERERGITIFSKNASVEWKGVKINIIDTPGHADFGGEVERVLRMADGVLLLVDAQEGPMPQTRFVMKKALALGLDAIVVINKIDKKNARPLWALENTFDLFIDLGASDRQMDFPVLYAIATKGLAGKEPDEKKMLDISPILDGALEHFKKSDYNNAAPLQMLVVSLASDDYKGRIGIGKIIRGTAHKGEDIACVRRDGTVQRAKITALMTFEGLERVEVESVEAGDIAAIAGIPDINIGDTISGIENPEAAGFVPVEPPTVKMNFGVNTSPFAGKEGKWFTSRHILERLNKELETDVALKVENGPTPDVFIVSGRGELHLSILIERMRREGYEFQVSRPQAINLEKDGKLLAPHERVQIEIPDEFRGVVMEKLGKRRGELLDMKIENGIANFVYVIPTEGLFGYRSEFMTDTKGLGIINTIFDSHKEQKSGSFGNPHGSLVAFESGETRAYGLLNAQERGRLFIGPGIKVYKGMVIGSSLRGEDLAVNVCKEKRLSNMRSKGDGEAEKLDSPKIMTLEESLEYIGDDELVEVTPQNIRIRKKILDENERKKQLKGLA